LWILHDDHHGADWRSSFGEVTFDEAWAALAQAVLTAGVVTVRDTIRFGVTCAADVVITLNGAPARCAPPGTTSPRGPRLG